MPALAKKEMLIPGETSYLNVVRQEVCNFLGQSPLSKNDINLVQLAIDEAVANIMEHSQDECRYQVTIEMTMELDGEKFVVVLRDSGKEFNPMTIKSADIQEHVRKGKKRGLGMLLMRQIMDEITYSFVSGSKNELKMTKIFNKIS
jgi:serine/threonine-protein kinase RsbW